MAVDIQEYSRVISSGLLAGPNSRTEVLTDVGRHAASSKLLVALRGALQPLIDLEAKCIDEAEMGNPERLNAFIEHASLQRFAVEKRAGPDWVLSTLRQALARLERLPAEQWGASLIARYYGGAYFSFSQAICFDALRSAVRKVSARRPAEANIALGVLLSTASAVANTVGKQFAQPIRLRKNDGSYRRVLVERAISDRRLDVFGSYRVWAAKWKEAVENTGAHEHRAVRADYKEFLAAWRGPMAAVYADPPYTIDHYSRFYHVLETLCLYDEPELAVMRKRGVPSIMRGLYRAERCQSPFCIPSTVERAFEELFSGVARLNAPLILSYSPDRGDGSQRPRLVDLEALTKMAKGWFSRVEVVELTDHAHRKLYAAPNNRESLGDAEVLLRCRGS